MSADNGSPIAIGSICHVLVGEHRKQSHQLVVIRGYKDKKYLASHRTDPTGKIWVWYPDELRALDPDELRAMAT
jgi:hypothetical protein